MPIAFQASIDDVDQAERLAKAVLDELGPVDVLVHNAGIASRGADVAHTEPEEVERLFRTHALARVRAVQAPGARRCASGSGATS